MAATTQALLRFLVLCLICLPAALEIRGRIDAANRAAGRRMRATREDLSAMRENKRRYDLERRRAPFPPCRRAG